MLKGRQWVAVAAACLLTGVARADLVDPAGDTFGVGAFRPDIVSYSADIHPGNATATFRVLYSGPIAAPSAFAPNSISGLIDIDADRNAATGGNAPWGGDLVGGNSWINNFVAPNTGFPQIPGPLVGLGDEFYIDITSEVFNFLFGNPGVVDVIETASNSIALQVPITFSPNGFTVELPLNALGLGQAFNFGVLTGSLSGEPTDRAPNGTVGGSSTLIPEPGTLLLAGLAFAAGLGYSRRRGR